MPHFANREELGALANRLDEPRPLPNEDPAGSHIVYWHVFRGRNEALDFARQIKLNKGERLVGGSATDSIGPLMWLGVQVDDLEAWGNRRSINKTDAYDPESPGSPML